MLLASSKRLYQTFPILFALLATAVTAKAQISGSIFTTNSTGTTVNQNQYSSATDVYLSGGPQNVNGAGLTDGTYYFQVTDPSGKTLLSTDNAICRIVTVTGGRISGVSVLSGACAHAVGTANTETGGVPVQLAPFAPTPNNGGEYKAWLIATAGATISLSDPKVLLFSNSDAKTDNFKIKATASPAALSLSCPVSAGQVGTAYLSTPTVTGGTGPFTFFIASGSLPTGLSLNTSTGAITGTPSATGTFNFSIGVKDSTGLSAVSSCSAACAGNNILFDFASPSGTLGTSHIYTVNGIRIVAYGFTNAGAPTALYGKADGADETGVAIAGGSDNEIETTNFLQLDTQDMINAGVTAAQMAVGSVQAGESYDVYGSNTLGTLGTKLISASTLDGTAFNIPGIGTYRYIGIQAHAGNVVIGPVTFAAPQCSITISQIAPLTGSIKVVKIAVGGDGTFNFNSNFGLASMVTVAGMATQTFSGLTAGGNFSLSETATAGWTQTSAVCTAGTPAAITVTQGGVTVCTITNTKASVVPSLSLNCPSATGQVGVPYSSAVSVTGGTAPFTFSVSGSLPAGLTLNTSTGAITGTPTTAGTANFSIVVTDSTGLTAKSSCTAACLGQEALYAFTEYPGTLGASQAYTINGITITAHAYNNDGTPAKLYGKADGPDETGLGISGTVDNEIDTSHFIQLDLTNLINSGAKAALMAVGSVQTGESYNIYGSNVAGAIGTLLVDGSTVDGTAFNIPDYPNYKYVSVRAKVANVVLGALTVPQLNCSITIAPAGPPAVGSIKVIKNTIGGDGTFTFSSNFGLTTLTTVHGTASQTFTGLAVGAGFNLTEMVSAGWTQTSAVCNNGLISAIAVLAGQTTVCTITNTNTSVVPKGSITVIKNTVGGDGTFTFTSNFGLSTLTTAGGTATATFANLDAGSSYSLSETASAGWALSSATCTSGTISAIHVVAGQTTVCTLINTAVSVGGGVPDLTITKSHIGNFTQGDTNAVYTLTVTNNGTASTGSVITVTDQLPNGLTLASMSGSGWVCAAGTCTTASVVAPGASLPPITVKVNVAATASAFGIDPTDPSFRAGDIFVSLANGTVQWRHADWTLVKELAGSSDGQAKGTSFDASGNLYVTHWTGSGQSGNDVESFDTNGNSRGVFGTGYNCNPSSITFDASGNAYVGQADCTGQVLKFDPAGKPVATFAPALEDRGTYDVTIGDDQCTLYYTSEGPDVKRFDVCANKQLPNFNTAPLPDPVAGAVVLLPTGGMLVANSSVITRLDANGAYVRTYDSGDNNCWLGVSLNPDGTSFWASDWCKSAAVKFDLATGNVLDSETASASGFMLKRISVVGNTLPLTITNVAIVSGGGDLNLTNNLASDITIINPPVGSTATVVNAATYSSYMAAGSIAAVYGNNLATGQTAATTLPLPITLGGATLTIGGHAAPIFFASPSQVNVQIPWEAAGQTSVPLTTSVGSTNPNRRIVQLSPFAPGIFTLNGAGTGQAVALVAGTTMVAGPANSYSLPATRGGYISIYCTGLGPVTNPPATGLATPASGALSTTLTAPKVTIGGVPAEVSFSGLAPGLVGVYQVNVKVPVDAASGNAVPLTLSIGGIASNSVSIAVQ